MKLKKVKCNDYENYTKRKDLYCNYCGLKDYCKKGIIDFSGWDFEIVD